MKFLLTALLCAGLFLPVFSQHKSKTPAPKSISDTTPVVKPKKPIAANPKPYKDVIPDSAVSRKGLFTVHKVGDKWYFEIGDSLFNREILTVTRFSKSPAGSRAYGGEEVNEQTIRWEKGPSDVVFMRVVTVVNMSADSSQPIARAVRNSNLDPIVAAFDIEAYGKDSNSVVIDVTDFFKGDNQPVSLSPSIKRRYNLSGIAGDRSYISFIHTFPLNTE